ncbi:phosphoinositide phospholipase C 2-like [Dorcoceras hygrometricum]|uniref:Phosphoinositide phospholipase C 2-like n=1 Tax=Dorcoceras hygrometricum TaxID=472368 RepID=A0A2Z7B2V7_9LAMI|nr:phosphoinositide phospholipase C 2-like [Dorcoceras hygrometricum]
MSIELQSDFSKGKSGNISSDKLTNCARSVDAKISKDWSRREDIQTETVKGRLRWTGRRYLAGTVSVGDPDPPPGQAAEEQKIWNREAINTKNNSTCIDIHRAFSVLPRWHLCLAPTGVSRTRRFSVDCGSYANPVHDQIRDSFVRLH